MTTPVLICDDSAMARKQLARALPEGWDVDISYAKNGLEGLEAIRAGKGDILFLDLTMPELDGYGVLEHIRKEDLPTLTIVVSGDIQPEARNRVMQLGALDFIKKPVNQEKINTIFRQYGIEIDAREPPTPQAAEAEAPPVPSDPVQESPASPTVSNRDIYQEIANVGMGQAASLLAQLLGAFVILPVPKVSELAASELHMALQAVENSRSVSGVCQGFIGSGIAGEALLIFNDSSFQDIARLMKHQGELDQQAELELLMDISNILIGACLQGIGNQLDLNFSQGHPVVLGQHCRIKDLLRQNTRWDKILTIEIGYQIEHYDISCDLLLLFTEDSLAILNNKASYLVQ